MNAKSKDAVNKCSTSRLYGACGAFVIETWWVVWWRHMSFVARKMQDLRVRDRVRVGVRVRVRVRVRV
jgi:hypothetical protein